MCKEAGATSTYNCIAWTLDITTEWVWDQVDYPSWGGNGDGNVTLSDFAGMYALKGKSAIVYGNSASDPLHGAKPSSGNCASSKLGANIRITHDRNEMEGGSYGHILATY